MDGLTVLVEAAEATEFSWLDNTRPEEFFPVDSVHYELAKSFLSWSKDASCFLHWRKDLPLAMWQWEWLILGQQQDEKKENENRKQAVENVGKIRKQFHLVAKTKNNWNEMAATIDVAIKEVLRDGQSPENKGGIDMFAKFVKHKLCFCYELGTNLKTMHGLH